MDFGFDVLLFNGNVYGSGTSFRFSGEDSQLSMTLSFDEQLIQVDQLYAEGDYKYESFFGKIGDKNNLYTYNNKAPYAGIPDEQYRITIPLPTGYTTDDIKNVIYNEDLIIEFNDKSIYIADKKDISKLVYNENLSILYKNGKIIKVGVGNYIEVLALLEDKCLYEIKF